MKHNNLLKVRMQCWNLWAVILLATCFVLGGASVARAADFTIADGDVTALISAINAANGNAEPDTINLATGGTYKLTAVNNVHSKFNGMSHLKVEKRP